MLVRQGPRAVTLAAALCAIASMSPLSFGGLDAESDTDSNNPAAQLYSTSEAQRRAMIARQIDLNRRMIWSSGYAAGYAQPFEPWPTVPGDIWGYPRPLPIEQPLGHESVQTAPNRWIYRPLYANALQQPPARPEPLEGPKQLAPQLPGPSNPEPEDLPLAAPRTKKKPSAGPREF